MKRFLLTFLLASSISAQTVGQYEVRKRTSTGFTAYGVTLSNGQVIGQTAGVPAAITVTGGGGGAAWGDITGTLSAQTDLQTALNAKLSTATAASTYEPIITTGSLAISKLASSAITIGGTSTSLGGLITASAILDSIGSTQGAVLYRNASGWVALSPGTNGQVLTSGGAGANITWSTVSSGSGDVVGPASATDNAIARFNLTTGKLIQNSAATLSDAGWITAAKFASNDGQTAGLGLGGAGGSLLFLGGAGAEDGTANGNGGAAGSILLYGGAGYANEGLGYSFAGGASGAISLYGADASSAGAGAAGGSLLMYGGAAGVGGSITTANGGGGIDTKAGWVELGESGQRTTIQNAASADWTLTLPTTNGSADQVLVTDGNGVTSWQTPAAASGNVSGPGTATDNAIARFDLTTGKILQDSGITIADGASGTLAGTNSGDVVVQTSAADVLTSSGSALNGVDAAADKLVFWDDSATKLTFLTLGTGLSITDTTINGGLSYITESLVATSPNGTVNAAALAVTGGTTNADLVLSPKGTGALLAQIPDSTTTAGNKRGTYAVDWQIIRGAAADVASGIWSTISGGKHNKANAQYATVVGGHGNIASGENAVAGGWFSTASGASTVALGYQHTVAGNYAAALGGIQHTASGAQSVVAGGYTNTSSGQESAVLGGLTNTASATHSVVIGGTQGKADRQGMVAHSAGMFAAQGDAQDVSFVLRTKTTTNAAVEMYLNGSSVRLTIPSGKVLHATVKIVGVKSDGTSVATYLRQVCIKNVAGTTALVGSVITLGTDEAAGTSVSITASDANDALVISPTGITSETWRWVAVVEGVEVAYGT